MIYSIYISYVKQDLTETKGTFSALKGTTNKNLKRRILLGVLSRLDPSVLKDEMKNKLQWDPK